MTLPSADTPITTVGDPSPVTPLDFDDSLRTAAQRHPTKPALADSVQQLNWRALDKRLNQIAHALVAAGIEPNDPIAILGCNSVDYATLFLGGLRAGACIVPLSTMGTPESLAGMINNSGAKLLFVSQAYANLVEPVAHKLTSLLPNGLKNLDYDSAGRESLARFIEGASAGTVGVAMSPDWGFNLIYSSGTTGQPKGILHDRRFRALERQAMADLGVGADSRALISTPLYSNTTLFMFLGVLGNGGTAHLMERFDTGEFLRLSETQRITHAVLVPVQYERLLQDPRFDQTDLSAYQLKFSTSAPLHKSVKEELLRRWPAGGLLEIYGMTEGGVVCMLAAHERPDKLDTVGQPVAECDLKIIDDAGNILPRGEVGEVIGHTPRMMKAYHGQPEATAAICWYDEHGKRYYKSGDIGWLDEENFLHLLDRKKDVIISGGFNIYAIDLESVLLEHPDVDDVAVVAAPSQQWGETPVAFVVAGHRDEQRLETIRTWANGKLGKAQRISAIHALDELPRNPIGKVLKRELRDRLAGQVAHV